MSASSMTVFRAASRASSRMLRITRSFSSTSTSQAGSGMEKGDLPRSDIGGPKQDKKHALEKGHDPNVQTHESQAARSARSNDTGGTATEEKDHGAKAKAKKEFPESPDQIGFEAERGGKW